MRLAVQTVPAMVALSFVVSACSVFGGKAAEEPAYRIVLADGAIQVREYGPYAVAETVVREPFDTASRAGFGRLFDYISGANQKAAMIDMTAPVAVASEEIAMTAPVLASPQPANGAPGRLGDGAGAGWTITFVLPEGMTVETAPRPADARVTLRDVPARRVAAIRFSGRFRNAAAESQRRELAAWLEGRDLAHEGDWRMAGYNPPWTLPPLRRNEVLVTLTGDE
ncbi:MAG: heme-binding protein [Caldilineaceae bacterium SB0665_bin_25]|nr:heme-binding protein [Caldilineaceae bacterium SB0665_bin_25]